MLGFVVLLLASPEVSVGLLLRALALVVFFWLSSWSCHSPSVGRRRASLLGVIH